MLFARLCCGDDRARQGIFLPVVQADTPVGMEDDRLSSVLPQIEPYVSGDIEERAERFGVSNDGLLLERFVFDLFDREGGAGLDLLGGVAIQIDTEASEKISGRGGAVSGIKFPAPAIGFIAKLLGDIGYIAWGKRYGFGGDEGICRFLELFEDGMSAAVPCRQRKEFFVAREREECTQFEDTEALSVFVEREVVLGGDGIVTCFEALDKVVAHQCNIRKSDPAKSMPCMDKCPPSVQRVVRDIERDIEVEFRILVVVKGEAFCALPWIAVSRRVCRKCPEIAVPDRDSPSFDGI